MTSCVVNDQGSILGGGNDGIFFLLHRDQISSGAHPSASYPVGTGFLNPRKYSGRGMKLTTHLHLGLRLGMSGNILPLPNIPGFMV
jgi:hypothetical protein